MNINFDTDVFKKILDVFSGMSAFRSITMTLCIICLMIFYVTAPSWKAYVENRLNNNVQTQAFNPDAYALSKEKKERIETILIKSVTRNKTEVAMVIVYKFVPEADNFFQYRVKVGGATNPELSMVMKKYNLDVLPFSALRAQIDPVMSGKVFAVGIDQVINEFLQAGFDGRDRYLSPINYQALSSDGAKYVISVPVQNLRVIGYVSVYFREVPSSKEQTEHFLGIARSVAGEAGYYIAY